MAHPQKKINVLFITNSINIGGIEQNILDYLDVADKVRFNFFVGSFKFGSSVFENEIRKRGIPFIYFRFKSISILYFLKKNKIDIIQLYGLSVNVLARPIGKLSKCKVIATIMSVDAWRKWYHVLLDRLTSKFTDLWISNSEAGKKVTLEREKYVAEKIVVIHNGINLQRHQRIPVNKVKELKRIYGIAEYDIVIGEVANLRKAKGHIDVINAIPKIIQKYPNTKFFFAGEDMSGGEIAKYAKSKGVYDYIIFAGYCNNIPEILSMFDIFILPSLWEGLPTSISEAMAIGLPIIASNVGGIPELVDNGVNGILIEPNNPQQLASSLLYLLQNRDVVKLMGEKNIKRVRENHNIKQKAKDFERLYINLLNTRHKNYKWTNFYSQTQSSRKSTFSKRTTSQAIKIAHVATVDVSVRILLLNQLISLQKAGYVVTAICNPGPYLPEIEATGIRVLPVRMTRNITPISDLRSLWTLYNIFLREHFTIVHTHTPKPGLLGQLAAKMAGVPIIINTLHGFYFHEHMHPILRRFYITLEKIAALNSDIILSQNSEDIETAIREGICQPNNIKYLGNGIDLVRFNPSSLTLDAIRRKRTEVGLPNGAKVVGFVGRLVREKGLLELFAAIRIVKKHFPNVKLLIIGPVDYEKPDALTPETAMEYGIDKNCIFLGFRHDMPELYALMDILVLPSHREGFPRSPMEASAMGAPVIATNIRGCREAVKHSGNGLLVPLGDVDALAKAICRLLGNQEEARSVGKEGQQIAKERFDEQKVFQRVKEEYSRLLIAKGIGG